MEAQKVSVDAVSNQGAESNDLRFYRSIMLLAAGLIPVFGIFYSITDPDVNDPLVPRYTVCFLYAAAFAASFFSSYLRKHIRQVVYLLHGAMMVWLPYLVYVSDLRLNYSLGYIMTFSAMLITFKDNKPLIVFIIYSVFISALVVFAVSSPDVAPLIFIGSVATIGAVLFFAVGNRNDALKKLEEKEKMLSIKYLESEAANKELNRFAYIVSHDLKAPLRSISSLASWLNEDYKDKLDEEGKQTLNLLSTRVLRMHSFIEGILEYSLIGRTNGKEEQVDLNTVIKDVKDIISVPETVSIHVMKSLPVVKFDHLRIIQVFQNLVDNAVKFMDKASGNITIDYVSRQDFYEFSISDNGPGIEEKHYERIFEIFQTLNTREDVESTGLGLTIVKKIIESNGGIIWVESKVGIGTTFKFTLPTNLITSFHT